MMKTILALLLTSFSMATATEKLVVFDFGGVMTGPSNREVVVHFLQESFYLSDDDFRSAQQQKRKATQKGMSDTEFWLTYANENGYHLPKNWVSDFHEVLKKGINPSAEMYELVAELQEFEVCTGMLSNIDQRLARIVRELGLYEPFEPCLLSCEIGYEKPHNKAYQVLLDVLGASPENVIFIDDRQENVDAALELEIDAILFQTVTQLRKELNQRGLVKNLTLQ